MPDTKQRTAEVTKFTGEDRVTVRLGEYLPYVKELAAADERSISDWVKRQLAKVVKRRYGCDPTRHPSSSVS